jgi:ABC-type Na+ efflux pump permease subunit
MRDYTLLILVVALGAIGWVLWFRQSAATEAERLRWQQRVERLAIERREFDSTMAAYAVSVDRLKEEAAKIERLRSREVGSATALQATLQLVRSDSGRSEPEKLRAVVSYQDSVIAHLSAALDQANAVIGILREVTATQELSIEKMRARIQSLESALQVPPPPTRSARSKWWPIGLVVAGLIVAIKL